LIEWSDASKADFADILAYCTNKGEKTTGNRIVEQIHKATRRLKTSPLSGRPGSYAGTREIVLVNIPYIIVYTVLGNNLTRIVRVMHTSRLWPPDTDEEPSYENH
jgi:addiction module RelE/StbE family toxin